MTPLQRAEKLVRKHPANKELEAAYDLGRKDGHDEDYKDGYFHGYNAARKDIKEAALLAIGEEEDEKTMLGEEIRAMRKGRNGLRRTFISKIAKI